MTPQEALAQAMNAVLGPESQVTEAEAEAILDALSGGWALLRRPTEKTWYGLEHARKTGAQQERERLRKAGLLS